MTAAELAAQLRAILTQCFAQLRPNEYVVQRIMEAVVTPRLAEVELLQAQLAAVRVCTVEGLEALPSDTLGIADGTVFRATADVGPRRWQVMDPDTQQWTTSELLLKVDGPLTVIYRPDGR